MRFVAFRKSDYTLPAKVALEAPVATHAPLGPLPRPLLRTCAAEKVVFEIHAQHARQLRHTASPLAHSLGPLLPALRAGVSKAGARLISFDFLAPSISQSAQCRQVIAHEQHGLHLEPLLRCSPCCAAGRNLAAHADGGCGKRKVHWETAYYEGLAANQLYIIKTVTQSGRP